MIGKEKEKERALRRRIRDGKGWGRGNEIVLLGGTGEIGEDLVMKEEEIVIIETMIMVGTVGREREVMRGSVVMIEEMGVADHEAGVAREREGTIIEKG